MAKKIARTVSLRLAFVRAEVTTGSGRELARVRVGRRGLGEQVFCAAIPGSDIFHSGHVGQALVGRRESLRFQRYANVLGAFHLHHPIRPSGLTIISVPQNHCKSTYVMIFVI